ncbi:MAG: ABC transporter permease [Spirochaetaceae bacterium]|nr:MAG: ABC transporter permease [Spirochaetaceae bacterium]
MKTSVWHRLLKTTEFYLVLVILLVGALISTLNPEFLSLENLLNILRRNAFLGVFALGLLPVLISGGIDVSFTAVATVAQYIMALIITTYSVDSVLLAFLIPIPIGILLGAINASIVSYTRVHPVIITIATLNAFHGLLVFITGGTWIYGFPASFAQFARARLFTITTAAGRTYGVSVFILIWLLTAVLTWFILQHTRIGRKVFAIGGNLEAARRSGFNIFGVHLFVYGFTGALAGIAAVIHTAQNQMVEPNALVGRELAVVAAVILGGASIFGGKGTVLGTVLGVLLIGIIRNGVILVGLSSYWHQVTFGFVIVVAASINAVQSQLRTRNPGISL